MTRIEGRSPTTAVQALFSQNPDGLRDVVRTVLQEMLEAEMTAALGAAKGERSEGRLGYRSGSYARTLVTRVGKLELRVPQDRDGRFSTELFVGTRPDLRERDFTLSSYTSDLAEGGRSYRCFTMNFFAFNVLVMGFTGPDALDYKIRYAREFEAMQAELKRRQQAPAIDLNDPAALRGLLLAHTEKVIELQGQLDAQAPKLVAYARIAEADGSLCIRDAAKSLQVRPIDLKNFLVSKGWIYKRPGTKEWSAYQPKLSQLLLRHKTATIPPEDGHDRIRTQVRVTPKGLARLAEEMAAA